jgi:hypothetical protein
MAQQGSGLGTRGLERFRENLGAGIAGGDKAHPMRGAIPGSTSDVLEEALFGQDRPDGPINPAHQAATPWFYPESSRIHAYQYDPDMQQLRVKFIKYGTPWVYDSVPSAVFEAFAASPSKGTYVNSTLNYFPYRKANAAEVVNYFQSV